MNFYLKGAPCLVKGLIICCYKLCVSTINCRELFFLEVNSPLPYLLQPSIWILAQNDSKRGPAHKKGQTHLMTL